MGVQMRQRPLVTGRDAKRFVDKSKENRAKLKRRVSDHTKEMKNGNKKEFVRSK